MPTFPCNNRITCEGSDNPIANLSSEDIDGVSFFAAHFGIFNPFAPFGYDHNNPTNSNVPMWVTNGCARQCISFISQEAAQACSDQNSALCDQIPPRIDPYLPPLPPFPPVTDYPNNPFPPVPPVPVPPPPPPPPPAEECLITTSSILPDAMVSHPYSVQLSYSGNISGQLFWIVVSGEMPDGLVLDDTGTISGTPTASGLFNFTVSLTNDIIQCQKEFSINTTVGCDIENALWETTFYHLEDENVTLTGNLNDGTGFAEGESTAPPPATAWSGFVYMRQTICNPTDEDVNILFTFTGTQNCFGVAIMLQGAFVLVSLVSGPITASGTVTIPANGSVYIDITTEAIFTGAQSFIFNISTSYV